MVAVILVYVCLKQHKAYVMKNYVTLIPDDD